MNRKWQWQWQWRWMTQRRQGKAAKRAEFESSELLKEVREAHREWELARARMEWVTNESEIDIAIYRLAAAEKRYEMLLRQAKAKRCRAAVAKR